MKLHSKHAHAALVVAVAGAIGISSSIRHAMADSFTTSVSTENNIETGGPFAAGANDFSFFQKGTFPAFGLLDFSSAALGIPSGFTVTSVNSDATLTLGNFTSSFNALSTFDVYLSNNNVAASTLVYQPTATPLGVGTQLDTLFPLGNLTYTSGGTGTSTVANLTLSPAAESYLVNQINATGNLRIIMVPTNNADVEFVSPKSTAAGVPAARP